MLSKYSTDCSWYASGSLALVHSTAFLVLSFWSRFGISMQTTRAKGRFVENAANLRCIGPFTTANTYFWAHTEMVRLALSKWRYNHFQSMVLYGEFSLPLIHSELQATTDFYNANNLVDFVMQSISD